MVNLIKLDCMRVAGIVNQLSNGVSLAGTLILSMYMLYHFLGIVALVGVGICIISIIANYFLAKLNRTYQKAIMELKDERMKKTGEALQNVKILKMYGWCELFQGFIAEARKREVSTMQTKACITGLFLCALYLFPKLVSIGTFFIYASFNDKITLGAVFATINIFTIMAVCAPFFSALFCLQKGRPALIHTYIYITNIATAEDFRVVHKRHN